MIGTREIPGGLAKDRQYDLWQAQPDRGQMLPGKSDLLIVLRAGESLVHGEAAGERSFR